MNYSLNQLAIFLKIVQSKSITKTAEAMHLTQPAVSIQLKNFQTQFSIPLIEIINKRVYITEFGREIAESAQNIMNEISLIDNRLTKYSGSLTGTLRMSCVSTGKYVLPYFLADFLKENQNVDLSLDVSNKSMVLDLLEQNQSDFSLVSVLPMHAKLQKIELMPNSLYLIGAGNQSIHADAINKQTLEKLPLIYREEGSATRMAMEKFIEKCWQQRLRWINEDRSIEREADGTVRRGHKWLQRLERAREQRWLSSSRWRVPRCSCAWPHAHPNVCSP
jgi:DNA-binding transcriptional LysR family regulator